MSKFNMSRLVYLKSLAGISPSMRFNTVGDNIIVSQKNENVGFIYSFPKADFPFEGSTASFLDYKELVAILNMLSSNCEMTQDEDNRRYITFIDAEENIKVSYTLSDDNVDLSTGPLSFDFGAIDASVALTTQDFSKIRKFISAVSAEWVDVHIKSGSCTLKFFRDKKGDCAEMTFAVDDPRVAIDYVITSDFFTLTPEGTCSLDFKSEGIVRLKYNTAEGTNLAIITGIREE